MEEKPEIYYNSNDLKREWQDLRNKRDNSKTQIFIQH